VAREKSQSIEPAQVDGAARRYGKNDKAFAPVALLAMRGSADDAHSGRVAVFEGEACETGDDGLKLIMIGRPVRGKGNNLAQSRVSRGEVANLGAAL